MRELSTRPLTPDRIAQAFPLIQASLPGVTAKEWCDFAAALISPDPQAPGGLLSVVSEQGYIAGLCSYRIERDLVHGRTLCAEHFLAFGLFDREAVAQTLAARLEALARERHCRAVHINLPPGGAWPLQTSGGLAGLLQAQGHRVESLRLCKRLSAGMAAKRARAR
jgi:hypothetical protein